MLRTARCTPEQDPQASVGVGEVCASTRQGFSVAKPVGVKAAVGCYLSDMAIFACALLQGIILARMLGPGGRGIFGASILWPGMFVFTGLFGVNRVLGRAAASAQDLRPVIRSAVLLTAGLSLLSLAVGAILLPLLIPADKASQVLPLAYVAMGIIPLNQISIALQGVYQGAGDFRRMNIIRVLMNPTYVILLLALWFLGVRQVLWVVLAYVAASAVVTFAWLCVSLRTVSIRGEFYPFGKILSECWRFGIANTGNQVYQRVDQIILVWLLAERDLGLYLVAFSAAGMGCIFMSAIGAVGFTKAAQSPPRQGFARVAHMFRKALLLWVLAAGALGLAMPILLPLVFGRDFASAVWPAVALLVGLGLFGLTTMFDLCMYGQGRPLTGLRGRIGGSAAMAVAGYFLAGPLGIMGVVIAYDLAQIICLGTMIVLICRHYDDRQPLLLIPRASDAKELLNLGRTALGKLIAPFHPRVD